MPSLHAMNLMYFSGVCDEDLLQSNELHKQPYNVAQRLFESALVDEWQRVSDLNLEIISLFRTEYFPRGTLVFKRRHSEIQGLHYLGFINLPFLREASVFFSTCISIFRWCATRRHEGPRYLFSSYHFLPVSLAIVIMGKLLRVPRVVTFTDLSVFSYSAQRISKMPVYKRLFIRPYVRLVKMLEQSYDGYVLFSAHMNPVVNPRAKPSVVVEGIYNDSALGTVNPDRCENAIAHAGTLNREYGIGKILEVFALLEDPTLELWLIGTGDMDREIAEMSLSDPRIKHFGLMPREAVYRKLIDAKLLVNLRNPDDIYTRYSFPSKMFEYMASGTAVLTTRLLGIPVQYYDFVYSVNTDSSIEIAEAIRAILAQHYSIREEIGHRARDYVRTGKNRRVQASRILDLITATEGPGSPGRNRIKTDLARPTISG